MKQHRLSIVWGHTKADCLNKKRWSLYWLHKDNLGGRCLGLITPWFHVGIGGA